MMQTIGCGNQGTVGGGVIATYRRNLGGGLDERIYICEALR